MNKYIDSIYRVNNNTFALTPLIVEFYKKLEQTNKNVLLSYLVLPLVLNKKSKEALLTVNTRSSIYSFVSNKQKNKDDIKNVENIFGLPSRINEYKELTNSCLQYAIDSNWISINTNLSVNVIVTSKVSSADLKESQKAASNLHKIFKDLDIVTIYRLLGIKKL